MKKIMVVLLLSSIHQCYAPIDPCVGMAASGIMCMVGCIVAMKICTTELNRQIHQHHTHGHHTHGNHIEIQPLVSQPEQQSTAPTILQQQPQGQVPLVELE